MKPQEEKFITDEIYGWKKLEVSNITISPELVVSINEGFGYTDIIQYPLFGELRWDEESKSYKSENKLTFFKGTKFNIIKDDSLFLYKMIQVLEDGTSEETRFFAKGDIDNLSSVPVELNGTNVPIYKIIEEYELALDLKLFNDRKHNLMVIHKYIKFFFYNVIGRHGKFYIIEDHKEIDNILKNRYEVDDNKSIKYESIIEEDVKELPTDITIKLQKEKSDENWVALLAYMMFQDSLFKAYVILDYRTGLLLLKDEKKLVTYTEIEENESK